MDPYGHLLKELEKIVEFYKSNSPLQTEKSTMKSPRQKLRAPSPASLVDDLEECEKEEIGSMSDVISVGEEEKMKGEKIK